jgi:hypothetical protein
MKRTLLLTCLSYFIICGFTINYDPSLVEITKAKFENEDYVMVSMSRKGEKVKAKYFTSAYNGDDVYTRYLKWSKGKNIILLSSAGYINNDNQAIPDGLTIDDGNIINNVKQSFDGLVIVYPTGGIAVSNLKEGNLFIKCNSGDKTLNLNNSLDISSFKSCAQEQKLTVFQTHLLVYKDQLKFGNNYSTKNQERRFLAVGKDKNDNMVHVLVHHPLETTLKEGAVKVFNFLKDFKEMKQIIFMINLDTGRQNVFKLYDKSGNERFDIKGQTPITQAVNLLVYYFE